ncbi:MAG: N-acetylglucosaminyl deacetylase, LmbE family [Chloroflexi bacterium]|jgi:LmbE family N-acetylglucosaminyl deacetylase|nr:MAG: N-acetylglucosaminyl deacetylase, LmbE family [Chloroflexota bacterium]
MQEPIKHEGPGDHIMVIVAHPDDAEFMKAGSVAKWIGEGRKVSYLLCTSGDKGTSDPAMTPDKMGPVRQAEQRAACAVLGVEEVVFLGYPDGLLVNSLDLRRDISREIRRLKPSAVLTEDPTWRYIGQEYINHPDHRAAGDAALDAVFPSARDYHVYPDLIAEGLLPHKVPHVYLSAGPGDANVHIDISEVMDIKIKALHEHKSQMNGRTADDPEAGDFVRMLGKYMAGDSGMEYAEAFKYFKLD